MNLSNLFLSTLFQCFPVDAEGLHDYKGDISKSYHNNNNTITMKDSVPGSPNEAQDGTASSNIKQTSFLDRTDSSLRLTVFVFFLCK